MTAIVFDSLKFAEDAQKAGFTKEQAKFQAEQIVNMIETQLATKNDITEVKNGIKIMADKLTIRFGGMLIAAIGIMKYFHIST